MKSLSVVVATLFAAFLSFGVFPSAFANDMTGILIPQTDRAETHFIGVKNISLRYPAGSEISQALSGQNARVQFTVEGFSNSTDNGISNAIAAFNKALVDAQSPAQVTEMEIRYTTTIRGFEDSALMNFKIEAIPKMDKFVISSGEEGDAVDLLWRGIHVTEPIRVNPPATESCIGDANELEINIPLNVIGACYPELAEQIDNSEAQEIFTAPVLNFERFQQSMDTWHFLFDPSGSLVESSAFFREESGAKVVSIYSLGESSFREGTFEAEEEDVTATIGGAQVEAHSQIPKPSGQIQIAGFSTVQTGAGGGFAIVTQEAPANVQQATGNFPLMVLLVLGGMMGAIAIFIMFKARK
ncbi:hypothetical protein [Candidatus Nitrososphaera sp. FF02]|uniref:hypothetical protein n=1 Tax=Candidatus Nitrososphaera sp. FF02 TaxID=3398226 RepID=UPI0039E9A4B8